MNNFFQYFWKNICLGNWTSIYRFTGGCCVNINLNLGHLNKYIQGLTTSVHKLLSSRNFISIPSCPPKNCFPRFGQGIYKRIQQIYL